MADFTNLMGWQDRPKDVARSMMSLPIPLFSAIYEPLKDSGKGKIALLHEYVTKVAGEFPVYFQKIGDCFNGSALVRMHDGSEKRIEDIIPGEKVVTPFGNVKTVLNTIKKPYDKKMVKITSKYYSRTLECTPDHLLMQTNNINDGHNFKWSTSSSLQESDTLLVCNNTRESIKIQQIEIVDCESPYVYCIEVEDDNAFICNGYGVHNCVSHGTAQAVNVLKATEIVLKGEFEEWAGCTTTEDIYGGSRVQVGKGQLGYGDGSIGSWAGTYVTTYGTLIRKKYDNIDLSVYSGDRAKDWGAPGRGTPSSLFPYAKEHLVKTISQIGTYEEARDALCNGYPISICSNQGFTSVRDKDGFAQASGSWPHCMCLIAVDDAFGRPGCLIMNSWGPNWISGPKRHNQPDGSFWCDAQTINRILSQGDSWAFSNFDGFKPQKLNLRIF